MTSPGAARASHHLYEPRDAAALVESGETLASDDPIVTIRYLAERLRFALGCGLQYAVVFLALDDALDLVGLLERALET